MGADEAFGTPRRGWLTRLRRAPAPDEPVWAVSDLDAEPVAADVAAQLAEAGIECEVRSYVRNPTGRGFATGEGSYARGDLGPHIVFGVAIHRRDAERARLLLERPPDEEELARESERAFREATGSAD